MKNYGHPEGVPIEQALQAYLDDRLDDMAPKVVTKTGLPIGFSILEWRPGRNVWEEACRVADTIGYGFAFDWVDDEARLILTPIGQADWSIEVRGGTMASTIILTGHEYKILVKRTGVRCPSCGYAFQPGTEGGEQT